MATAVKTPPVATSTRADLRRITEADPDYQRLHQQTTARLARSVRQYIREEQRGEQGADSRFIQRHVNLMKQAYIAAHHEGQKDYWPAVSRRTVQHRFMQPDEQQTQKRLTYYALGSVLKLAHQVKTYVQQQKNGTLEESTATNIIALAAPATDLPGDYANRVALQGQITWSGLQDGYSDAGGKDSATPYTQLYWNLGPVITEHCFPGGTLIMTPDGEREIVDIRIGDQVQTTHGARRVTKVYRSLYFGQLAHIEAADHAVDCTPNHPFLTQRGWVEAKDLLDNDVVIMQDGPHFFSAHVRLPDTRDGITAGDQIGILRSISPLLRFLARREWFKSRVSMPVVAVGLDDQGVDTDIDHKLILDHGRRLEDNTEFRQNLTQAELQLARLGALDALVRQPQSKINPLRLVGMFYSPFAYLIDRFRLLHRIVLEHIRLRLAVNNPMLSLLRENKSERISFIANLLQRVAECFTNFGGTVNRIVLAKIGNLLSGPHPSASRLALEVSTKADVSTVALAFLGLPVADMPALGADFHLARLAGRPVHVGTQVSVSARDTAKAANTSASPMLIKRLPALLTNKLYRHSGTPPVLTASIPHSTVVFNLEVEGVHEYIANGFVVHNCDDCPDLAMGSPYDPPWAGAGSNQLNQTPGDGQTECGAACKCSLSYDSPSGDALVELGQAIADKWNDWYPSGMDAEGNVLTQPITPPGSGTTLTDEQKSALDNFRNSADMWDTVRRQLPPMPSLFGTEDLPSPLPAWEQLTAAQQAVVKRVEQAQEQWLNAAGKLVPAPILLPDPATEMRKWLEKAGTGAFTPWWNEMEITPSQEDDIEAWLDAVARGEVVQWPTPAQPAEYDAMQKWLDWASTHVDTQAGGADINTDYRASEPISQPVIQLYNPNHDSHGRFTYGNGTAASTVARGQGITRRSAGGKRVTNAGAHRGLSKPGSTGAPSAVAADDIVAPSTEEMEPAKELASRLAGNKAFEDLAASRGLSTEDMADNLKGAWDGSSNDPDSVALKYAVTDEFGLKGTSPEFADGTKDILYGDPNGTRFTPHARYEENAAGYRAFARAQYDSTQDYLKSKGVSSITVYRGSVYDSDPGKGGIKWGRSGEANISTRAISSFSTDPQEGDGFAGTWKAGQHGLLMSADVPASRIFSFSATGLGTDYQHEILILGGSDRWSYNSTIQPEEGE